MSKPHNNIAKLIKEARSKSNMSQRELSTLLEMDTFGTNISRVERGLGPLPFKCFASITSILNIKGSDLIDASVKDLSDHIDNIFNRGKHESKT